MQYNIIFLLIYSTQILYNEKTSNEAFPFDKQDMKAKK